MKKIIDVYKSLKWKKKDATAAEMLKMDLAEYIAIKHKVVDKINQYKYILEGRLLDAIVKSINETSCETKIKLELSTSLSDIDKSESRIVSSYTDLDTGKVKLEAQSLTEPKTAEEIIELLKIDVTKWKLSQYWNKQKSGYWIVSALVTQIKKEESDLIDFFDLLKDYSFPKAPEFPKNTSDKSKYLDTVCGILSLQDLHYGKNGNENLNSIVMNTVNDLLSKSTPGYNMDKLILVIGGDCLNMDTFNGTTTKGTPVESSMSAQDTYIQAFEGLYLLLLMIKEYVNNITVVFIPGNHDRLSSFHLVHALSKSFENISEFTFHTEYSERKVVMYGENMFCFEHGDVSKKTTPLVYATEYPMQWGQSTYRTLFTGHYHTKKTTEYITDNEVHGFTIKILPSLSPTDYWHYHNKFVGNKRAAVLELHHKDTGKVAEFNKNYKL